MMYSHVNILCEGQSEEIFAKRLLAPYFSKYNIYITPIILGGVARYGGIRRELKRIGKDSSSYLSTMLDFYKLPQDTPGMNRIDQLGPENAGDSVESEIYMDLRDELNCRDFIPNLLIHEYEALLFSNVECFSCCEGITESMLRRFSKIRYDYATPEQINSGEQTAPSKRILQIYPSYQKISDGILIASNIGIEKMLEECPHFAKWIQKIQELSG